MAFYKTLKIKADLEQEIKSNQTSLVALRGDISSHKLDITFLDSSNRAELDFRGYELSVGYIGTIDGYAQQDIFVMEKADNIVIPVTASAIMVADTYTVELTLTSEDKTQVITCPKNFSFQTREKALVDSILEGENELDSYVENVNKPSLKSFTDTQKEKLEEYKEVKKVELGIVIAAAEEKKLEVEETIEAAESKRIEVNSAITNASSKKTEVESIIEDAEAKKVEVEIVISSAKAKKIEVESTIEDAEAKKVELQAKIDEVPALIQSVNDEGTKQVELVKTKSDTEIVRVEDTGNTVVTNITDKGNDQIQRVVDKNNEYIREVESDITSIETTTIKMKSALESDYTTDRTILQNATDRAIKLINDVKNESMEMLQKIK